MTTLHGVGVLMCALVLPFVPAVAQISVTPGDVSSQLVFGNRITERIDLLTTSINIGSPGSTSWDFGALNSDITRVLTSVDPAGTPYGSQFPNPTHALQTTISTSIGEYPITVAQYQYLKLGTTLSDQGTMAGGVIIPGLLSGLIGTINAPSSVTLAFPCTFGSSWTSTFYAASAVSLNDSLLGGVLMNHTISSVVDAFGPMTLPGGSVQQALRIRKTDVVTPVLPVFSPFTILSYTFIARNGAMVNFVAFDTTQTSGMIRLLGVTTWRSQPITDVPLIENTPAEFALMQNYPNPFNPSTSFRYALPHGAFVTLAIFNTVGQEVARLVHEQQEAGTYQQVWNAEGMASGVYFYRLSVVTTARRDVQAGDYTVTKKMILLR